MDKRLHPKTDRHLYKQDFFDYSKLGFDIKVHRMVNNHKQQELADKIGCVRSTISKLERGMPINPVFMLKIALIYKMNLLDYCTTDEVY